MLIFRCIFLSNYWCQISDIWSQASYRYPILWEAFLDPWDSCFLFADLVGFYTHWTYMHIFLSNYWWQRSDIWSQASYRYPILWEAFFNLYKPNIKSLFLKVVRVWQVSLYLIIVSNYLCNNLITSCVCVYMTLRALLVILWLNRTWNK